MFRVSTLYTYFQEAFDAGGATAVLQSLALGDLTHAMKSLIAPHHFKNVSVFLARRYLFPAVSTGAEFWPRHWAGVFLHRKAMENNVSASSLIIWLQYQQHVANTFSLFGFSSVSTTHAVMWTELAAHFRLSSTFPYRLAYRWCGALSC